MEKMVQVHESTIEALNESKIVLDRIVTASDEIRECKNNNELPSIVKIYEFGFKVIKILKEYMAFKGESRLGWGIYIWSAIIGIVYFAILANTSQLLLVIYFGVMNVIAFIRLTLKKNKKTNNSEAMNNGKENEG